MTYLPDINVWIALAVAEHIHFKPATAWFQERIEAAHDAIAFCRVTQMGFLRLLTRSTVMGSDALTPAQAWDFFDKLRSEGRLFFADEPSGLESNWRSITRHRHSLAAASWTDAYLAAFAATSGFSLVTFDRGLARQPGIQVRLLTPPRFT